MTRLPLLLFLLALLPCTLISHTLDSQRSTLLSIRQQWRNPQALSTWNPTTSPCSWYGIQCSTAATNTTRAVTGISLFMAGINFTIPPSICDLKSLQTLNLSWNNIPGSFPTSLGGCSALTILDLSANLFVGPIPDDVDKLLPVSLQYLNLNENMFNGSIPKSIGGLKELKAIYLTKNSFNGIHPSGISNLSKLEDLQMDDNPFIPMALPSQWGNLKNLKILMIKWCNLVGQIPESFGGLLNLERLDLSGNRLVGRIPDGLFLLKSLSFLHLYDNKLSGEIPSIVHSLNLRVIHLYNNTLSGSIPEGFGKLRKLQDLSLFMNNLYGGIPASIGLLPELEILKVFSNNLSGPLPPELGFHSKLKIFEIGGNHFSGPLPQNVCYRGALIGITAFSNNLNGEIPKSLGNCTTLTTLKIYNNNFTGEIPAGVWTLPALDYLMFGFNGFSGPLPDRLPENMIRLEVHNNKFTGQIPNGLASLTKIQVFSAGNNSLSGTFPLGLISLSRLQILSLEGNQLFGELPLNISYSWSSLTKLNLGRNQFSGSIPGAIGSAPTLDYLDLSCNDFSGEIPSQFEQLKEFSFLNFSSNKLLGEIPYSLDNDAFAMSFLNNTNLCTSDKSQILTLPKCSSSLRSFSNCLSSKHLAMIIVLVAIVFLVTLYFTVFVIKETEKWKCKDEMPSWQLTSFHTLHFTEVDITSKLAEDHVIGSGASGKVYRVQVGNNPGYFVAVKRIWNNHKLNNAQFLAEVQILGDIRHANIVKLLCCISSENSRLLVYEFMENQSLDRLLHRRKRLELESRGEPLHVLDWPTRLRIAIGVAQGLSYMHHGCSLPIIHRDIKSSNILLDSEFNAKIADFGLAKIVMKQGEFHTMSNIVGTFGYFAPEYRKTKKVNEKVDVYSFGVILLELVTGKEANGEDESLNLAEWSWKHHCEDTPIIDVLDEEVVQQKYIEEMSIVFTLGLICTNPLPNKRPSMKDILEVLHRNTQLVEDSRKLKVTRADHLIALL